MSNYFRNYDQREDLIVPHDREISRILTAAIVNEKFRKLLLANPEMAIHNGFGGEAFCLAQEETDKLAMIHAVTLADFASQMNNIPSRTVASR